MSVESLSAHLVPGFTVTISLSRFESTGTAIGNSVDVSDGSKNFPSKDLVALSVRILLDGLLVDMVMVKGRALYSYTNWAYLWQCFFPR